MTSTFDDASESATDGTPSAPAGYRTVAARDGTTVALDPGLDDQTLRAWRHAAVTGGLPEPTRDRWQQLRAGVVNMWEFDVAEYWTADGRAQFVGNNEQGKSTMMAMTTLTMLTGDLAPRYVDTFGNSQRTFRYYLIPTDSPKDRRPITSQLNRGWTWVEYGRRTKNGPEYFTTLLFAQARRTSAQVDPTWVTHHGPERVRAGLTLVQGQAVVHPSDLPKLPGLDPHPNGKRYKKTVASVLFGFTDPERLHIVVELLKTLRTPKLGNHLRPEWIVDRIRESLPPLETSEITELAEGWDQLGQLAQDRDDAREAREAVRAYLQAVWNPWADAVLRRAADELAATVTAVDDVTRERSRAEAAANVARQECEAAETTEGETKAERGRTHTEFEQLVARADYRTAADAGAQVESLTRQVKTAEENKKDSARTAAGARQTARERADDLEVARGTLAEAEESVSGQADLAAEAGSRAGLPDARRWAAERDTERLLTAVNQRLQQVRHARDLDAKLRLETERHERALGRLADADKRLEQRRTEHTGAETGYAAAAQTLSDALEAWAVRVDAHEDVMAPAISVRERWLDAVQVACAGPQPAQQLGRKIRDDWLTPALEPVNTAAITAHHEAEAARSRADALEAEARKVEAAPAPVPAEPRLWRRRARPASGPAGAPLWELLDPLPHLEPEDVAGLEAALAGAGLLDAWVTPDGIWAADRDGHDHLVAISNAPMTPGDLEHDGATLRAVLGLAEKAQEGRPYVALAGTADSVLDAVALRHSAATTGGERSGAGTGLRVGVDGSWSTPVTTGHAIVPSEGASLLGASARVAARARAVAALRKQAALEREQAAEHDRNEERHRLLAATLTTLANAAPDDIHLVNAARDLAAASGELQHADDERRDLAERADAAEAVKNRAQTDLITYASDHHLQVARLADTETALHDTRRETERLVDYVKALAREQSIVNEKQALANRLASAADDAETLASQAAEKLEALQITLNTARRTLSSTHQELLKEADQLRDKIAELDDTLETLNKTIRHLGVEAAKASQALDAIDDKRTAAEAARTAKLAMWWVAVDAGLAAARGADVTDAPRTLTAAVGQIRALRAARKPPRGWPETSGAAADSERERILGRLRDRLSGTEFITLNNTLDRTGGRAATVDPDDETGLPQVRIRVDASGRTLEPTAAVHELDAKAAELSELHDEQMHEVMQDLLASTFVDHLRAKVKETSKLINDVNEVLDKHPTGTTRTIVRLQRKPVAEHVGGFQVLQRLLNDSIDSPAVQDQVQTFLATQIRSAQDEGHMSGQDWKELLVDKLDYRNWFAVVTEWRVLASAKEGASLRWSELTTAKHSEDSGGAKVMTMLQPLLATLATLYQTSRAAPRPLWLDEAFDGLDQGNTSSLLAMMVEFDFDFLLAGPKSVVASREVPCAAVWMVNRAPAPMPGVDLGLWLFAGGASERIQMAEHTWSTNETSGGSEEYQVIGADVDKNRDGEAMWE